MLAVLQVWSDHGNSFKANMQELQWSLNVVHWQSTLKRQGLFLENGAEGMLSLHSQKPFIALIVQQKMANKLMIMLSLQDILKNPV